jgi:hypothetical protein
LWSDIILGFFLKFVKGEIVSHSELIRTLSSLSKVGSL